MAIIYTYPTVIPEASDILLGTEQNATLRKPTKNFKISDIAKYIIDSVNGTDLTVPIFFDVTDPHTGLTHTTLVDSIMKQNQNPNGSKLTITGGLEVTDEIYDSTSSPGTTGQVLSSTATGTKWITSPGSSFIFTQSIPVLVWNIQHNLNKFPSVTAVDNQNDVYYGAVEYVDSNNITITWGQLFQEKAYLN